MSHDGPPSSGAPAEADVCEHLLEDALSAPDFQKLILQGLATSPTVRVEGVRPFLLSLNIAEEVLTVRLDGAYKRYRHGEITPEEALDEVKAALGVPGASVVRAGPFPRLGRASDLPLSIFRMPCDFDPVLVVFFVWHTTHGAAPLSEAEVQRDWSDHRGLLDLAIDHLRRRTEAVPASGSGDGARLVLRWNAGDGLDAAALLLPDLRSTVAGWLEGELLMAVPARDLLIATGGTDPAHVASIAAEVREAHATLPEPLSPRLYRVA